jgi:fatty acid desaturase
MTAPTHPHAHDARTQLREPWVHEAYRLALRQRRRRRIRSAVRAAFWSTIGVLVLLGVNSIEDQREGWWILYGTAVLLLVGTAVLVHLAPRDPR